MYYWSTSVHTNTSHTAPRRVLLRRCRFLCPPSPSPSSSVSSSSSSGEGLLLRTGSVIVRTLSLENVEEILVESSRNSEICVKSIRLSSDDGDDDEGKNVGEEDGDGTSVVGEKDGISVVGAEDGISVVGLDVGEDDGESVVGEKEGDDAGRGDGDGGSDVDDVQ